MKEYTLSTVKNGTKGLDTEVNLKLKINSRTTPTKLSDFYGGTAELYNGYTTSTHTYTINYNKSDNRRLSLINQKNKNDTIEIMPEFIRIENPKDLLNQLEEVDLKIKQDLSDYTITNSNWKLK